MIIIYLSMKDIEELFDDLNNEKVLEKFVVVILDEIFDIKIEIENQKNKYLIKSFKDFKLESESDQLFYVNFDLEVNDIEFYYGGELLRMILGLFEFMCRMEYLIKLELIIFYFEKGRNLKFIFLLNKRVYDGVFYFLVYFN